MQTILLLLLLVAAAGLGYYLYLKKTDAARADALQAKVEEEVASLEQKAKDQVDKWTKK